MRTLGGNTAVTPPRPPEGGAVRSSAVTLACHKGHITPKAESHRISPEAERAFAESYLNSRPEERYTTLQIFSDGVRVIRSTPNYIAHFGRRGSVRGLSARSRSRLVWMIDNTPALHVSGMVAVTLTYPKEFSRNGRIVKNHLDTFAKRTRRLGGYFLWVLEYQERGAPHFHLMAKFPDTMDVKEIREWVAEAWFEIVDSGDEKHLRAGTRVEKIKTSKGCGRYMAKYLQKNDQKTVPAEILVPGRMWGKCGVKTPKPEILLFRAMDSVAVDYVRFVRRCAASQYAFFQRNRVWRNCEKVRLNSKMVRLSRAGKIKSIGARRLFDKWTEMLTGDYKGSTPPEFRRAWSPKDSGKRSGFRARGVASALKEYIRRISNPVVPQLYPLFGI